MGDLATGVFSHTDYGQGEEISLPEPPSEGSAADRARGPHQKPDQTACHQLKPGSFTKGE